MKIDKWDIYRIADAIQNVMLLTLLIAFDLIILCGCVYTFYCNESGLGLFLLIVWILFTLQLIKDLVL